LAAVQVAARAEAGVRVALKPRARLDTAFVRNVDTAKNIKPINLVTNSHARNAAHNWFGSNHP